MIKDTYILIFVFIYLLSKMMFKSDTPLYSYEVVRESSENVMYINYLGASFVPSLIDSVLRIPASLLSEIRNLFSKKISEIFTGLLKRLFPKYTAMLKWKIKI